MELLKKHHHSAHLHVVAEKLRLLRFSSNELHPLSVLELLSS